MVCTNCLCITVWTPPSWMEMVPPDHLGIKTTSLTSWYGLCAHKKSGKIMVSSPNDAPSLLLSNCGYFWCTGSDFIEFLKYSWPSGPKTTSSTSWYAIQAYKNLEKLCWLYLMVLQAVCHLFVNVLNLHGKSSLRLGTSNTKHGNLYGSCFISCTISPKINHVLHYHI